MKKKLFFLLGLLCLARLSAVETGPFNVRDFGAKGDGRTADSAAIQKAVDAASKVNGTVFFPPGKYLCHDIRIPSYVCLKAEPVWGYGAGVQGAVLVLDSPDASALLNITDSVGVRLHGLLLTGEKYRNGKTIHGIYLNHEKAFSKCENIITIEDCKVTNFSGHGVYLKRVWLFIIRHSEFMKNAGCGVRVFGWDGFVSDNQLSGNGQDGFSSEYYCAMVMFTANRVEWNRGCGLNLNSGDDWNITGNSFDGNFGAGVRLEKIRTATITGNTFRRCGRDCSERKDGERSSHLILTQSQGVAVTGNAFAAKIGDNGKGDCTPQTGMIVEKLTESVIVGNVFHRGYTETQVIDRGGHGPGFILKDNPGSAAKY